MVQFAQPPRSRVQAFAGEIKPVALALGLVFGLGVGTVPAASAATITVNNLSGTTVAGQCTLRDALLAADTDAAVQGCAAGSGADTINFSVTGTIPLATQLTVNSDVTISGPGAANLTLAPSSTNRALYLQNAHTVSISGVTFQGNGTAIPDGAAIYNYAGALTIQNSVFSGNVSSGQGGAIYNYGGKVVIKSSTFSGNRANMGGAIYNYRGTISIDASTLSGNQSSSDGGAIALYQDTSSPTSSLTITNSTLSGNRANGGTLGGAISMHNTAASSITNSTISGNSAGQGGAIVLYRAILVVSNSTITGNSASGFGGAFNLFQGGDAVSPRLDLVSTIVANNTDNTGTADIARITGTVNATSSLIFNPAGNINGINVANITGQNPLLGALANNGGPTLTHALLAGSPAIDKGINPLALAFDQRGTPFARSSGVTDIGAFEIQGAPPPAGNVPVPTLSQWSLALLSAMMAGWAMLTGFGRRRRK